MNDKKNLRETGAAYENAATVLLKKQGVTILERNFRCRIGEIDIIGKDGDYIVFFEVKYRKDNNSGTPEEAVGFHKQKKICKTAGFYRMKNGIGDNQPMRYDVIAINGQELRWYKNAFFHIE